MNYFRRLFHMSLFLFLLPVILLNLSGRLDLHAADNSDPFTEGRYVTDQAAAIVSDDFSSCVLDTELWTFINPLEDSSYVMTGEQIAITVPAGTNHDVWPPLGNQAPRIMQAANDTNFELEVKFDSPVTERYQVQGIIVEQDAQNFLRLDFHYNGASTRIFAARFDAGAATQIINRAIAETSPAPLYMRIKRVGDSWTQSWSLDGEEWTVATTFDYEMVVKSAGLFAGNIGGAASLYLATADAPAPNLLASAPAHTAVFDYFFNMASPIDPEDGRANTVTVNIAGDGDVVLNPDKVDYACGEEVVITAVADPGWSFVGWSGDIVSTENPLLLTVMGDYTLTANFEQDPPPTYLLTVTVVGAGGVMKDPDQSEYQQGEQVILTAVADPGWVFTGWSGGLTGDANPATLVIEVDTNVTATFEQEPPPVVNVTYLPIIRRP
jgi:hypothetical protein